MRCGRLPLLVRHVSLGVWLGLTVSRRTGQLMGVHGSVSSLTLRTLPWSRRMGTTGSPWHWRLPVGNTYITPDVEAILIGRFRSDWPGVRVARDAPAIIPDRLVTIRRSTPGHVTAEQGLDQAHIDVNVWHSDPEQINGFAAQVASWMGDQVGGGVRRVSLTSPADPGDSRTGSYRRFFYADLVVRRVPNKSPAWATTKQGSMSNG